MPAEYLSQPLLKSITPNNLLSFGKTEPIELRQLNVLIGPNGSGKSNLIELIALLRGMSQDLSDVFLKGGGADAWVFKGAGSPVFGLKALVSNKEGVGILHEIEFVLEDQGYRISKEMVGNLPEPADLNLQAEQSILHQTYGPGHSPELTLLKAFYSQINIYREWQFGRGSILRQAQATHQRSDILLEDFSNLGLFLEALLRQPETQQKLTAYLKILSAEIEGLEIRATQGNLEIFLQEQGQLVPVTRLSDGALRYLCLIAILCNPNPPPLICIEEPELGLHPDILPMLSDLLIEASERTQLIVTTHSDVLLDTLNERPEVVMVCEKKEGQTQIKRLNAEELAANLEEYSLGKLWMDGSIGGNRW